MEAPTMKKRSDFFKEEGYESILDGILAVNWKELSSSQFKRLQSIAYIDQVCHLLEIPREKRTDAILGTNEMLDLSNLENAEKRLRNLQENVILRYKEAFVKVVDQNKILVKTLGTDIELDTLIVENSDSCLVM